MKPRVGFFDFTGCEGCQLSVLNLEDALLELLDLVCLVEFREVMDARDAALDLAFVEGSICGPEQAQRLRAIRQRAKVLVALGACADTAGVNALAQPCDVRQLREQVYGPGALSGADGQPQPISAVVTVDARVPGCPIDGREFLQVLQALLVERTPELPNYPVCVECKLAELDCVFETGKVCLGPVTRAGCQACCVVGGDRCRGCRGLVDNPRAEPYYRILEQHGLSEEAVMAEFRLFNLPGRGGA